MLVLGSASLTLLRAVVAGTVDIGNNALGSDPAGRLPGLNLEDVHGVNLFQGPALGLVDEEEDNKDGEETAGSKDVTVAEVDGVGDEGGEEGDEEVPGPIGGSGNTHADSAVLEGVHLTTDSPDDRTPGGSEADDEEAGEDNHDNTSWVVGWVIVQDLMTDRGPNQEADKHPGTTVHQTLATAIVLHDVETGEGHTEVDSAEDDGGNVRVVETDSVEDTGSVVKDEVGTGKLLQGLQGNSKQNAVEHARTSEDLLPGSVTSSELLLQLLLHVGHFPSDNSVVVGNTVELAHDFTGLLDPTMAVGVTRGLGQEEGTDTEDERPGKSDTHGDPPGSGIFQSHGAEVDDVRDEDTEGDEQLEGTDHRTTDLTGSRFGLVHGDDTGEGTDTQTGDPTTEGNLIPVCCSGNLNDDTDNVKKSPERDGEFAANTIRNGGSNQGTNHSSNRQLSRRLVTARRRGGLQHSVDAPDRQ